MGGARNRTLSSALGDPATLLLISASLVAAGLILYFERRITFRLDEWEFLVARPGLTWDSVFLPHNEHIVAGPVLVYKALIAVFGTDSPRPFQIVAVACFIASVALLYVWLRRRIGEWLALAGCLPILFCGAAAEDLLWPFQIGFFVGMACGIGMLLALERNDRKGNLVACGLLFGSLAFSSLGLSFAAAAIVVLALGGDWLRRAFVVAIPVALYGVWYLKWGHFAENSLSVHNFLASPIYIFDGFASSLSSLLGFATTRNEAEVTSLDWGRVLLVAALIGAALRIRSIGSVPRSLWVVLALGVSFWFLAALNAGPDRPPTSGRYQYIGAVFVVMIAAELLRGVRPRMPVIVGVFAAAAVVLLSSTSYLQQLAAAQGQVGDIIRADLAAVEIAQDTVDPGFLPDVSFSGTGDVYIPASLYLKLVRDSGSPAFSEAELAAAPAFAREFADRVLARAERLVVGSGEVAPATAPCRPVDAADSPTVATGPATVTVRGDPGARLNLYLRRFATRFPVSAGQVMGGGQKSIAFPADRSDVPWVLLVEGRGTATVCGASS